MRWLLLLALVACKTPTSPLADAPPATVAAAAPVSAPAPAVVDYAAIVAAPDRTEADRALDAGRKPAEILSFYEIQPGMKVAELGAGGGYTAELLARIVGPSGVVYGQNSPMILEKFAAKPWAERLARPGNEKIVRWDSVFDAPLPPEARDLDAVFMILFYHDTVWMEVDRPKMNAAIFAALKPGGVYAVIDHSARAGAGLTEVKTTHRIEETLVIEEIEAAGFKLAGKSEVLANPADSRDWNANPSGSGDKRGTSDRFVLRFVKP
jgi:predicted methyltransferase